MTEKPKLLKSVNDFVIGLALLLAGVYILVTKNVMDGTADTGAGGIFVRPDVYVRFIGGLMAFFSVILIIKSFNFTRSDTTEGFHFALNKEVLVTVGALVLYALLLPLIHFFVSTFLLILGLTLVYVGKEHTEGKTDKKRWKVIAVAGVYSLLLTMMVYLIFSHVLKVALP